MFLSSNKCLSFVHRFPAFLLNCTSLGASWCKISSNDDVKIFEKVG
jgi:hypothetical protein